jgi:signal transduction histidine kinase
VIRLPSCGVVVVRDRTITFASVAFEGLCSTAGGPFARELPASPARERPRTLPEIALAGAVALTERKAGASVQQRYRSVAEDKWIDVLFNRVGGGGPGAGRAARGEGDVVVAVFNDVTGRIQADAALLAAETELARQERVRAIGELAAGIVHDVSNTLGAIRLRVSVLVRDPTCMAAQGANIAALERIVKEGTDMLQKLQRLGQVDEEKAPEPLDLAEIVGAAIEVAQSGLRHRAMNEGVDIRIENTVPRLPRVLAWRDDLLRVFVNLLINARDAMPLGGCVRVGGRQSGTRIAITVEDEGTGIPHTVMPHIFDSYFTTKGRAGTGMGLATVRRSMERLGGTVSVSNHARGGAVFTLLFPFRASATASDARAPETHERAHDESTKDDRPDGDHLLNPPD